MCEYTERLIGILHRYTVSGTLYYQSFDYISQLSDISREIILGKKLHGIGINTLVQIVLGIEQSDKMIYQKRYIITTGFKRWNIYINDIKSVIKILSEFLVGNFLLEINIC